MQFLDLLNRRFLRLARSPLQLLRSSRAILALGFDGVIVVVYFFLILRVGGVVVEFEILEVELRYVSQSVMYEYRKDW